MASTTDAKKYTSKLHNKRILIIGGSSGLGYAVAEASLEQGAHVIISSSRPARIESAISRLVQSYPSARERVRGQACDLASAATAESNIERLFVFATVSDGDGGGGGKLDHVVFTAGDGLATMPLCSISLAAIQAAGMVRFVAPLLIARYAAPHMAAGPASSITLTTGSVAEKPMRDWAVVASYAAGLYGMVRALALDLKPVRVNLVSPGAVATELWAGMPREAYVEFERQIGERALTGRIGRPEDVAEAYVYAMKDANLTGSVVGSDGGGLLV